MTPGLALALVVALDPWFDDFKTYEEIDAQLDTLAEASDASTVDVGASFEGRAIRGLRIGRADKPTVLILGTQHAREWASPMVTMCLADLLTTEAEVAPLLDRLAFVVVPVVNPDGYVYSWDVDRFWRKNRRPGGGVDLNRNWGQMWGVGTQGAGPSSEIYPGEGAFSEPETAAIAELADAHDVVAFVDYHSPVNLVLIPFAYTSEPGPHEDLQWEWGESMASSITAVHGRSHDVTKPGVGNPSGGLAQDWFAAEHDAISFTVELRGGPGGNGFVLPADEIDDACEENWAGFLDLAARVSEAYGVDDPPGGSGEDGGSGSSSGPSATGPDDGGDGPGTDDDDSDDDDAGGDDDADDDDAGEGSTAAGSGIAEPPADASGCGCRPGPRPGAPAAVLWSLLPLWFLRRRNLA